MLIHSICSYDSHLYVGSICLTFQAIKGIFLLIASIDGINKKAKAKKRQIKHHYQKPTSTEKPSVEDPIISNDREGVLIVPTICFQHVSYETPKTILDPIKPAYNICGGLDPIKEWKKNQIQWYVYVLCNSVWIKHIMFGADHHMFVQFSLVLFVYLLLGFLLQPSDWLKNWEQKKTK